MKLLITTLALVALALPTVAPADPPESIYASTFSPHMFQFRQQGLRGDRTHATQMIETLQALDDREERWDGSVGRLTLLHALAQMGDTDALAAFDHVIETSKAPNVVSYARVARARLVAEDAALALPAAARPAAVTTRLLSELGLTADGINKAVTAHVAILTAWKASLPPDDSLPPSNCSPCAKWLTSPTGAATSPRKQPGSTLSLMRALR